MPKLARTKREEIAFQKQETIKIYMNRRGLSRMDMANRLGIKYQTFCGKLRNVERFTCGELILIDDILKIPQEQYV